MPATPTRTPQPETPIPKPKGKGGGLVELVVIVALALGLALAIQAWIVKPYQIPSESMEPTLDVGQRVLVNRFIYHFDRPEASATSSSSTRRPAPTAAPNAASRPGRANPARSRPRASRARTSSSGSSPGRGDTVSVKNGHPVVDGVEKKDEPYINPCGDVAPAICRRRSRSRPITTS